MISFLTRLILSLIPILLTPLWVYLIANSYLNFGAGEKDLFLVIPWVVWAFLYLLIFIIAWIKRKSTLRIVFYSAAGATGLLAVIWLILFIWFSGILGIRKG